MSEDEEIKKLLEQKKARELEERLAKGMTQTEDGQHMFVSEEKEGQRQVSVIPRTVSSQINFTNILEDMIKNIDFVGNYSYDSMARGVLLLLQHIPEEDMDDQFKEDVAKAKYIEKTPTGRYGGFGGSTYEIMEEHETYDFLQIYRAIFNLLRRRGTYTLPRLWDERRVGVLFTREGENKPVERVEDEKK